MKMAKPTTEDMKNAFATYTPPGEAIVHAAYGVKQPHILIITALMLLGVLPGLIAVIFMTKHYLIGQSTSGVTILQVKSMKDYTVKKVMRFSDYDLANAQVKTSNAGLFTDIKIVDAERQFIAKFHKMYSQENRINAEVIAAYAAAA